MSIIIRLIFFVFILTQPLQGLWEPSETFKLKMFTDIQISPDNESVLILTAEASFCKDQFVPKLYLVQKGKPLQAHPFDGILSLPRWSPDGKLIAFLGSVDGIQSLYLMDAKTGLMRQLIKNKSPFRITVGPRTVKVSPLS